ncbi:MAG: LytTR family transcriptional regulator [Bacteroidales bacterium]|nr:LytTR family transcriptional regulator [Bacteroidales bacterium]
MYRVLFYSFNSNNLKAESKTSLAPITWFDGFYSKNEIPYPILFNKQPLVKTDSGESILKKGQRYIELDLNVLMRIESSKHGSSLILENTTFWTTEKTIDLFEKELCDNMFFRVNDKTLINLHHLESFITCDAIVTLSNKEAIPVDAKIKEKLFKFLEGRQIL